MLCVLQTALQEQLSMVNHALEENQSKMVCIVILPHVIHIMCHVIHVIYHVIHTLSRVIRI